MTDPSRMPPPEVQRAAGQVQAWLDQQNAKPAPPEVIAKMTLAQRLDYARLFDQTRMPPWKDWRDPR
jgi:hypothetical protein